MSEIKVGDKCRVSGFDYQGNYFDGDMGVVTEVDVEDCYQNSIKVKIESRWFRKVSDVEAIIIHRKQCRKLVKKNICLECNGSGKNGYCEHPYCKFDHVCTKCNGSGKIKK